MDKVRVPHRAIRANLSQKEQSPLKFSSIITAATLVVGTLLSVAVGAPANAAPNGNIVTLGDSYTANPDQVLSTVRDLPIPPVTNYPKTGGCLQAPNNWPRKLGAKIGAKVADWSCTAQTSQNMLSRLSSAIAVGDLHSGTHAVVIAVGINDYGPFGVNQGFQPWDRGKMRADYVRNLSAAAKKIRANAPNAKIVVSGMLAVSHPSAPNMFCPVNVIPNAPGGFPLPALQAVEADNEANQRAAARTIGATFVPLRLPSAPHSTCAPDRQRFVSGAIDTTTPNYTMSLHPSNAGSEFAASRIAAVL